MKKDATAEKLAPHKKTLRAAESSFQAATIGYKQAKVVVRMARARQKQAKGAARLAKKQARECKAKLREAEKVLKKVIKKFEKAAEAVKQAGVAPEGNKGPLKPMRSNGAASTLHLEPQRKAYAWRQAAKKARLKRKRHEEAIKSLD